MMFVSLLTGVTALAGSSFLDERSHAEGAATTLCDTVQQYSGYYKLTTGTGLSSKNCTHQPRIENPNLFFVGHMPL